jgi:ribosomal protein L14E/L6E/L27E
MLKQINDTILVTGPFKINGVPLRRINPAYVIATSTKIDLSSTNLDLSEFDEAYFKSKKEKKGKNAEEEFFGEGEKVFQSRYCRKLILEKSTPRIQGDGSEDGG